MGMTAEEFWDGEIILFWAYEKAARIKRKQEDTLAWMQGFYNGRAFADVLAMAFGKKGQKHESTYPKQPVFTDEEAQKKRKKPSAKNATEEEKLKIAEEIKEQFRILNNSTNAAVANKMGG